MVRSKPNVLVTGTPGVGKSLLCSEVIKNVDLQWIEVSKFAKSNDCLSGYDSKLDTFVLDEDKVLDQLEPIMENGGNIVEYHSCSFFPERWFDMVYVVTTDNTLLYDRLIQRGYDELKVRKNVECEIFQSQMEEAYDSYREDIVEKLISNTDKDIERNISEVVTHINGWINCHKPR